MKTCSVCKVNKPLDQYQKDKKRAKFDGLMNKCKSCRSEYRRKPENKAKDKALFNRWRSRPEVKEYLKLRERRRNLRKFGLTIEEWEAKLLEQDGRCAICQCLPEDSKRRFAVDHDHKTGKVRDILCHLCNTALGAFKDDQRIIALAIKYLNKHKN